MQFLTDWKYFFRLQQIVRPAGKYLESVIVKCGGDGRGRAGRTVVVVGCSHTQSLSLSLSLWDERFQEQLVVTLLPPLILGTPADTTRAPALQK